jgi:hypothetical protein
VIFAAMVVGAAAILAAAPPSSEGRRVVAILQAPTANTPATKAVFRFRTHARRKACRLDRGRFRRCRRRVVYWGLGLGPHTFTLRVRVRKRTIYVRRRWTVVPPRPGAVVPPKPRVVVPPRRTTVPVFEDHFNGSSLNTSHWSPYYGPGHAGNGLRRPSAFSLDGNGHLVVTARMVDGQLVSGGMANRRDLTYGRFEFRVRTEADPTGTTSGVVLTWPESDNWPIDGENDIYETGNAVSRSPFYSYVHYGSTNQQYHYRHEADAAQWHTFVMDWRPTAVKVYRDGALVWTLTDAAAIPRVPHHLCIQLDATASAILSQPVRMYVDYVRVYR